MKKFQKIRNILEELAQVNGFVINPICLQEYIYHYIKNNMMKKNKNSAVHGLIKIELYVDTMEMPPLHQHMGIG